MIKRLIKGTIANSQKKMETFFQLYKSYTEMKGKLKNN